MAMKNIAMKKKLGKKGFFFTFLSILLVSILLITFIKTPALQSQKQADTTKLKINLINDFTENIKEVYIPRLLYFTTMDILNTYATYTNQDDIEKITVDDQTPGKFDDKFVNDIKAKLNVQSAVMEELSVNKLNIITAIDISNIAIKQIDTWNLEVTAKYTLSTNTIEEDVSFSLVDQEVKVKIPIEGLYDPLFMRYASQFLIDGKAEARQIKKAANLDWGLLASENFFAKKLYRESTDAPGYLERLKGDFKQPFDNFGIETFLDSVIYPQDATMLSGYSHLDYTYFLKNKECISDGVGGVNADLYEISNIKQGFYLDIEHIGLYNLTAEIGQQYKCALS